MINISLQPTALFCINDSYQRNKKNNRAVGIIYGKLKDRSVRIVFAQQMPSQIINGEINSIDFSTIQQLVNQIKINHQGNHFRELQFVGWYSISDKASNQKNDIMWHKKLQNMFGNLFYLQINPKVNAIIKSITIHQLQPRQQKFVIIPNTIELQTHQSIAINTTKIQTSDLYKGYKSVIQSQIQQFELTRAVKKFRQTLISLKGKVNKQNEQELKKLMNDYRIIQQQTATKQQMNEQLQRQKVKNLMLLTKLI